MTVILPDIHDGELRRIEIPGDRSISLTFETIDKQVRTITLEGVVHLRCDNLLAGNIVFDIQEIDDPSLDDFARVARTEGTNSEKGWDYLRDKRKETRDGTLHFLRLESSYGCVMDALCRSYRTA